PAALSIIAFGAWRRPAGKARTRLDGWGIFLLPAVAAVACVALEFYDHYHRISMVAHLLASTCLLLVIGRLGISFAENVRMLRASRHEAVTDALTGLGNRRALEPALHERLHADVVRPFLSPSTTWTASRPTTTPSATRPATCCSLAWASGRWRRCPRPTCSGWAVTSSASSSTRRRGARRACAPPPPRYRNADRHSTSAARSGWCGCPKRPRTRRPRWSWPTRACTTR